MTYNNSTSFLAYYRSIRKRTKRIIAYIPPDKIEWTPKAGRFTLGDQIRHIAATERYMFAENVQGKPSRYPGCGKDLVDGYDNVVAYLDRLHEESTLIFSNLTEDDFQQMSTTPGNTNIHTWKWLRAMVEHEVHHRSQIYVYLGLLDVDVPQLYGLSSEEVLARSRKQING